MMDQFQTAQSFQAQAVGAIAGANIKEAQVPLTLSSACARLDSLNDRLTKLQDCLSMVASQLGAITPIQTGQKIGNMNTEQSGAVHRLNHLANAAHSYLNESEALLAGIQRALG